METPEQQAGDTRLILGNFNLTAQMPNGRTMAVSGYIYSDDEAEALNKRLDLYQEVIERQRVRCEIPELEAKREGMIQHLEGVKVQLAGLEKQQRESGKLSSQDRMNLKNAGQNIVHIQREIDKGEQAIAEAKRKAGVGG